MRPRNSRLAFVAAAWIFAATAPVLAEDEPPPIYGQQLMTQQEQEQYRERVRAARTDEDRAALREQHREAMQARARERGVELPDVAAPGGPGRETTPPARGPARGRELMTEEERERHRQEMRSKTTAEERERARREKHEEMKERAREQGVEIPDEPAPRPGGGRDGSGPDGAGPGRRR